GRNRRDARNSVALMPRARTAAAPQPRGQMAAFGRCGTCIVCLAVLFTLLRQNTHHQTMLEGIPSGKTRVLDLSYAISDKLVPWPGDEKFFEAKVNASIEKNGYFTRSFWMLEHYGTHLDAPA